MTNEEFWSSWLVFWLLCGPIGLGIVCILYSLYLGRHLDAMMEALRNSRFTHVWGPGLRNQGWFGRGLLIAKIAGMLAMPRASIRLGELDPVDFENFPPHLKRLLKIKSVVLIGFGIGLLVVIVLMELK